MRAGLAVLIIVATAMPRLARAQADVDEALTVPVHPRVTTILHLPDDIEHARFSAQVGGVMESEIAGHMLIIRPRGGTPAGTEVLLQVWTATGRQYFWLRVTKRARDASRDFLVPASDTAPEPAPVLPAELMAPPRPDRGAGTARRVYRGRAHGRSRAAAAAKNTNVRSWT